MASKKELLKLLKANGREDLHRAVQSGTSDELSQSNKELLTEYARRLRNPSEDLKAKIRNALVEVSTSGWSREGDTALPGKVVSSSERS